jgi:uncharacterized membrane protein YkvA (DUF1232 family)
MKLPLRAKATLVWRMLRDPAVPLPAKAVVPGVVAYLAWPIDIIPDFIPVLGQIDDVLVISLGMSLLLLLTPRSVVEAHLRALE